MGVGESTSREGIGVDCVEVGKNCRHQRLGNYTRKVKEFTSRYSTLPFLNISGSLL